MVSTLAHSKTIQSNSRIKNVPRAKCLPNPGMATKLCNIQTLLADLRWDTLACRRRKHRLTLLYKMKHGLTRSYLTHMIPNQSQDRYPLRNAERIPLLKVKAQEKTLLTLLDASATLLKLVHIFSSIVNFMSTKDTTTLITYLVH